MVVGNGMMAKAFDHFKYDHSVIIFASGVSNSDEKNEAAFKREEKLLLSLIPTQAKLVYCRTISVEDPSLQHSHYIRHKLELELLIENNFSNYLIFRLPNLKRLAWAPSRLTSRTPPIR